MEVKCAEMSKFHIFGLNTKFYLAQGFILFFYFEINEIFLSQCNLLSQFHSNHIHSIFTVDCCVNRTCWCFTTKGMCNVGQDEMVFVLEVLPNEETIPMDILRHFYMVYEEAGKGMIN